MEDKKKDHEPPARPRLSSRTTARRIQELIQEAAHSLRHEPHCWLSRDGATVHVYDGSESRVFPLKSEISRKFYRMMFDLPPGGDIDEVEAETMIGLPDHRDARKNGQWEVRLRRRIKWFEILIDRPRDRRRIRLKYPHH